MLNKPIVLLLGGLTLLSCTKPVMGQPQSDQPETAVNGSRSLIATTRHNSLQGLRQLALGLVNRDRHEQGVSVLVSHPLLNQVAQAHAEDMIQHNYLSHYAKDGSTPGERVRSAGGQMITGENILSYHLNQRQRPRHDLIAEFQTLFFQSRKHRHIMMRSRFSQFGYGFAAASDGRIIAVQLFGTPQ